MLKYRRDVEGLKTAIREHSIDGYPLTVPIFKKALGINTSVSRDMVIVVVRPENPTTFEQLADAQGWGSENFGVKHWVNFARERNIVGADSNPLKWIHPKTRAILEDGNKVSMRDIQKEWLQESGHVDRHGNVLSYSFHMKDVGMDPEDVVPGMIVEYSDVSKHELKTAGRVVGIGKDSKDGSRIVYLETFEPVPAYMGPASIAPELIQPNFVPDRTWVLGKGTIMAMLKKGVPIPSGLFMDQRSINEFSHHNHQHNVYFLDQPIPLSVVKEFCERNYPDRPECVLQSVILMVLPLQPAHHGKLHKGGYFKPYPDDTQTTEIEAQIDYFNEGMEFEE
jgi:hypothetical protein